MALGLTRAELEDLYVNSDRFFFQTKDILKPDGSHRYTFDVSPRLKRVHERICACFLKVVQYPDYLQGSLRGKDYLSNASKHSRKKVVISEDISNFFPSISKKVVHEVWVGVFGFSNDVAEYLAELITLDGFMVQGAKPSSYICNLVFWHREADLVEYFESKGYTYTRYVDDITVSTTRILSNNEKTDIVNRIYSLWRTVGVKPNRKKHRIMARNERQTVHKVNVNREKPTLPKAKRKNIKAAVYQCENEYKEDPDSEAYLKLYRSTMGRVNTLARMHPVEGKKLKQRLLQVKPIIL
ncbi:reverse transcriptase family protein [Shewanella algae]|uniref:reverse transcriptase family protein n=1 Tax=Shewanella algae TaxID=38313 RepID=UPI003AB09D8A